MEINVTYDEHPVPDWPETILKMIGYGVESAINVETHQPCGPYEIRITHMDGEDDLEEFADENSKSKQKIANGRYVTPGPDTTGHEDGPDHGAIFSHAGWRVFFNTEGGDGDESQIYLRHDGTPDHWM